MFQDYTNKAQRNLTEVKKDNDFIYHERIPDIKNVEAIGKANVAKLLPLPETFSSDFKGFSFFMNLYERERERSFSFQILNVIVCL